MRTDGTWSVADTAAVARRLAELRGRTDAPFDVAVPGESDPADPGRRTVFADHADAGATWWVEAVHPWRYGWEEGAAWPLSAMHERIRSGP